MQETLHQKNHEKKKIKKICMDNQQTN